jgi:hypothetical protein
MRTARRTIPVGTCDFGNHFCPVTIATLLTQRHTHFIPGQDAIDIDQNRLSIGCYDMRDPVTARTNLFDCHVCFKPDQRIAPGRLTFASPSGTGIAVMVFHELSLGVNFVTQ